MSAHCVLAALLMCFLALEGGWVVDHGVLMSSHCPFFAWFVLQQVAQRNAQFLDQLMSMCQALAVCFAVNPLTVQSSAS